MGPAPADGGLDGVGAPGHGLCDPVGLPLGLCGEDGPCLGQADLDAGLGSRDGEHVRLAVEIKLGPRGPAASGWLLRTEDKKWCGRLKFSELPPAQVCLVVISTSPRKLLVYPRRYRRQPRDSPSLDGGGRHRHRPGAAVLQERGCRCRFLRGQSGRLLTD